MDKGIPLLQASRQLGIDKEALRKRAIRGTVNAYKDAATGQWFVVLPSEIESVNGVDAGIPVGADMGVPGDAPSSGLYQVLLNEKDERIALLSHELETRNVELESRRREVQELHVLLQNTQRLLLLNAPARSPQAPQEVDEQLEQRKPIVEKPYEDKPETLWARLKTFFAR